MSSKNHLTGVFVENIQRYEQLTVANFVQALLTQFTVWQTDSQSETVRKTIPTLDPTKILGVPFPSLRKLAKVTMEYPQIIIEFLADNQADFNNIFEIGVLKCFVIELFFSKDPIQANQYMHEFIKSNVKNWMICDTLAGCLARLPNVLTDQYWHQELEPYLFINDYLYATRLAIVVATKFYVKNFKKCKIFLEQLTRVTNPYFYCQMAISWAIATAYTAYPQYCYTFLKHHQDGFLPWTFNKSLTKINQSFKVNNLDKKQVLRLKIDGIFKAPPYSPCTLSTCTAEQLEALAS